MTDLHGHFVWYELMTTDMKAAKAFYANVIGWDTRDVSMPGMAYILFTNAGASVSGLIDLPEETQRMGVKPAWIGYVSVDDVDASTDLVERLGGTVRVPPMEIPDVSCFSVFADTQMATLGLFKWLIPGREQPPDLSAPGGVGWHELLAGDAEKALAFYGALFGWEKADAATDATGTYQLFSAAGQTIGGVMTKPATLPAPLWLYYFNIGDIDAAAKRVKAGGGEVLGSLIEAPGGRWIVQCTDPQGAMFALVGTRKPGAVGYFERAGARAPSEAPSGVRK
jgi:predicted enzyme related to lactoylglutathione lyase